MMINPIKIQLVDDHELVRAGFRHLLEDHQGFKIVVESNDGKVAVADYAKFKPDIVLMDISMKNMSGLEATQHITKKYPDAKIIILSMQGHEAAVRTMEAGAKGFLSKSGAAAELITAIKNVMLGYAYIDRETAQKIAMHQLNGSQDNILKALSSREYEVFTHLAKGTPIDAIAAHCCLSPKTVRSHKSHIMLKLNLNNTIDFVRLAMREGIIEPLT
ncbi:MAG: response regulator transcription factor [Mariprofundaceae bacterium]